jgi:hypothetical protein
LEKRVELWLSRLGGAVGTNRGARVGESVGGREAVGTGIGVVIGSDEAVDTTVTWFVGEGNGVVVGGRGVASSGGRQPSRIPISKQPKIILFIRMPQ